MNAEDASLLSRAGLLRRGAAGALGVGLFGALEVEEAFSAALDPFQARPSGTLRVGLAVGGTGTTLDPDKSKLTFAEQAWYRGMYDYLFRSFDGRMTLVLAEEVSGSKDARTWDITLRDGVEFHNGKSLRAEDVVFTFRRRARKGSAFFDVFKQIKSVKKSGKNSVRVTLKQPNALFMDDFEASSWVLPVGFNPGRPVGTGPFKLNSWSPGRQTVLVAHRNYWGRGRKDGSGLIAGPYISRLEIFEFADSTARVNALLANQVDALEVIPGSQISVVTGRGFQTLVQPSERYLPFVMNASAAPFNDVRVRQAMKLIIDRPAMIQQALNGRGVVANDIPAPFDVNYIGDELPQRHQDIAQARSLLKSAGQENLTVELNTSDLAPGVLAMSQVLVEQAKQAGVTIKLRVIDPAQYYSPSAGYLSYPFSVSFGGGASYMRNVGLRLDIYPETHWQDPQFLRLRTEARRTVDDKRRGEILAQMQRIDRSRSGDIVWAFAWNVSAFSSKVKGIKSVRSLNGLNGYRFETIRVSG